MHYSMIYYIYISSETPIPGHDWPLTSKHKRPVVAVVQFPTRGGKASKLSDKVKTPPLDVKGTR